MKNVLTLLLLNIALYLPAADCARDKEQKVAEARKRFEVAEDRWFRVACAKNHAQMCGYYDKLAVEYRKELDDDLSRLGREASKAHEELQKLEQKEKQP